MVNDKGLIRAMIRGAYDLQHVRIEMGQRVVANFKVKLGIEPGTKEDASESKAKEILNELRAVYRRITDGVVALPPRRSFKAEGIIDSYAEVALVHHYVRMEQAEAEQFKAIGIEVEKTAIWQEFLGEVRGVGPAMAGVIISEIDIHKARYASSLWKYAGLDVAADGRGRSRRQEHLVKKAYTDKKGQPQERNSITFNPFLKTKLRGVLASSFLRAKDSPYAACYYDYKHRMESHAIYGVHNDGKKNEAGHAITSKGRRHAMAERYMIKRFLVDLYTAWRTLEGLPVAGEYSVDKLGRRHGGREDAA